MEKKINIVHIAQANGGVERYLKMFFKYSNKSKYNNYLIASQQYIDSVKEFEDMGVNVYILNMYREINVYKDFKACIGIYKILKSVKPDIVYCHSSKAGGLGRIPAKIMGAINIYNPHGWAFDMEGSRIKKNIYKFIERGLGYITNTIIAISKYEKDTAVENNVCNEEKITVIENGIDIDKFDNIKSNINLFEKLNLSKKNKIVGMVARISEQKSPKTFVEIADKLYKEDNNYRFVIVGDGEQRAEIEELIKQKGIEDKFFITGWIDNVEDYIKIFSVALLTSKWEGFGLVIPEYMILNKPVIASNVGGISEIITNEFNGFTVENLNVDKFVEKIRLLLSDPVLNNYICNNANELVRKKYDIKNTVKLHEVLIERILDL